MRRPRLARIAQEATLLATVVILALTVWFVIIDVENREIERSLGFSLPVGVSNLSEQLAVAAEPLPVSLTVVGTRSSLDAVSPDDFSATINARGRSEGQHRLPVRAESLRKGVRVRAVQPETAVITLQELIEREVSVRAETANPPPIGFMVGEPTVHPERAIVTGIADDVNRVETVVARLDLAAATVSLEADVSLEARTSSGASIARVEIQPGFARVAVPITQEVFRRVVAVRPDLRGEPSPGYRISRIQVEPSTVDLFVSLGARGEGDAVSTEPIVVDGRRNSIQRRVALALGDAAPAGLTEVLVMITIEPIISTVRLFASVRTVGNTGELQVFLVSPDRVQVQLRGPADEIAQLEGPLDDLIVDVSGLGPGRHIVDLTTSPPPGMTVTGLIPSVIVVVLAAPSGQPSETQEEGDGE